MFGGDWGMDRYRYLISAIGLLMRRCAEGSAAGAQPSAEVKVEASPRRKYAKLS
jgi:hypothetical protein